MIVAVVASIVLMSVDHRANYLESIRGLISIPLYPFQFAIHYPVRVGEWLSEQLSTRQAMLEENTRLREEQLLAHSRLARFDELKTENERLRDLLGSSRKVSERVLVAELISVDTNPFSRRLVLNKGTRDGVLPGQPLVDSHGVMGQIIHAGLITSNALLITDPNHALPVQIHRNRLRAVAFGTGPLNLLKLSYVPNSADVQIGDQIVTSGLSGRFPQGYPVGEVVKIQRDHGQQFAEILVQPSAMLERSREVLLVRMDPIATEQDIGSGAHTSWRKW